MNHVVTRAFTRFLITVFVCTWSGIQPALTYAQLPAAANQEERKRAVEKLERLFDALEEAASEIPRDTFDPEAIVKKVGADPEALFRWVRDNTYLVPYRGTLRGPIGVLMDRLGNSLDRSLLLAELLRVAGHNVRLAQGTLSKQQAEIVLDGVRPIPPGGALPADEKSAESMNDLVRKYADKYGLDSLELRRVARSLTLQQQHMAEEVAQRVEDQTKAILELVGEPKTDIRAAERRKAIEALQDHWWVQWKGESGWREFDSTLPEAKGGETLVEVEATYLANNIHEQLQHLVTIRIVIERWEAGKLEEEEVLEHTLRPSKLFDELIVLRHVPLNWPKDLDLFAEDQPRERLKNEVLEETEWLPVLSVGAERVAQSSFTVGGQVKDEPGKKPASPAEDLGKGVAGLFGGFGGALSGGEAEKEVRKESHLTAEWIEYEIRTPNEQARTLRREVFDLVGPAARTKKGWHSAPLVSDDQRVHRGLTLFSETEILIQVCNFSSDFLDYVLTSNFLSLRETMVKLSDPLASMRELVREAHALMRLPGPVHSLALARQKWRSKQSDIFLSEPNIMNFTAATHRITRGELERYSAFDIVKNDVAVAWYSEIDPFKVRIVQGVLDTNAEAALLGVPISRIENAAAMFDASAVRGVSWLVIEKGHPILQVDLSEDVRTRIRKDLDDGYVVVIPSRAISLEGRSKFAWWRIDPATGTTLGVGEQGWGQGKVLYAIIGKSMMVAAGFLCVDTIAGDKKTLTTEEKRKILIACVVGGSVGLKTVGGLITFGTLVAYAIILASIVYVWQGDRPTAGS